MDINGQTVKISDRFLGTISVMHTNIMTKYIYFNNNILHSSYKGKPRQSSVFPLWTSPEFCRVVEVLCTYIIVVSTSWLLNVE